MSQDELMTYSKLRKIQKEEKRKDDLVELDDNFLISLSNYLETKKKHSEDQREYRNAKRVFEKIISIREDKITKKAKVSAKTSKETNIELLPEEQELFRELKNQFSKHKDKLDEKTKIEIKNSENPAQDKKKTSGSPGRDEELDENNSGDEDREREEKEKVEDEEDSEYVMVEVKKSVPEFMGTDLETYGPFEEGDEAKIPSENAEILINRGNAEKSKK